MGFVFCFLIKDGKFQLRIYEKEKDAVKCLFEKSAGNGEEFKCVLREGFSLLAQRGEGEKKLLPATLVCTSMDPLREWIKKKLPDAHPYAHAFIGGLYKKTKVRFLFSEDDAVILKAVKDVKPSVKVSVAKMLAFLDKNLPCPSLISSLKEKDAEEEKPFPQETPEKVEIRRKETEEERREEKEEENKEKEENPFEDTTFTSAAEVMMSEKEKENFKKAIDMVRKSRPEKAKREVETESNLRFRHYRRSSRSNVTCYDVFYEFFASFLSFLAEYKGVKFSKLVKLNNPEMESFLLEGVEKVGLTPYAYFCFIASFKKYLRVIDTLTGNVNDARFRGTDVFTPETLFWLTVPVSQEERQAHLSEEILTFYGSTSRVFMMGSPQKFAYTEREYKQLFGENKPSVTVETRKKRLALAAENVIPYLLKAEKDAHISDKAMTDYFVLALYYSFLATSSYPVCAEMKLPNPVEVIGKAFSYYSKLVKMGIITDEGLESFASASFTSLRLAYSGLERARKEVARMRSNDFFSIEDDVCEEEKDYSSVYQAVAGCIISDEDYPFFRESVKETRNFLKSYLLTVKKKLKEGDANELEKIVRSCAGSVLDGELSSYDFVVS
jgi:hypothetical protein